METKAAENTISHISRPGRVTGLDAYRIIACMLVVINHCNSKVMLQVTPLSLAWYVTLCVVYVTKIAVPGFLMIAGYNLLHRQDDWKKAWERALRIFIVLVTFSFLYYIWRSAANGQFAAWSGLPGGMVGNFINGFVTAFWQDDITDAYWYLYMYLGLMLVLPFIQKLVKNMEKKDYHVFFLLALIFCSIIPMIADFVPGLEMADSFALPMVRTYCGCLAYMVVGHYFYLASNKKDNVELCEKNPENIQGKESGNIYEKNPKKGLVKTALFIIFAAGLALNMIISLAEYRATSGQEYLTVSGIEYFPLMIESLAAFAFLLKVNYSEKVSQLINLIAPATFGIYLLSDFLCAETNLIYFYLCPHMNRLLAVAVEDAVVLIAGFAIIWLLRKIPFVRKYI